MKKQTKNNFVYFLLGMAFLTLLYSVIILGTILHQIGLSPELSIREFPQILIERLQTLLKPNLLVQIYK